MGLYPVDNIHIDPKTGMLARTYNDFSGKVTTTYYQPVVVIEERTNCFCCSCGDREGSDPACRNHGYYGKRPCEEHGMPGSTWMDEDGGDSGEMPESVQVMRQRERALRDQAML